MPQPNLRDEDTGTTVNLQVFEAFPEISSSRIAVISIPERANDIVQVLGRRSRQLSVRGFTTVLADNNQLRTWNDNNTSLLYNDDDFTDLACVITGFGSSKVPGFQSTYREYSFTIIER